MNQPGAPTALSWSCPSCGRRVPMRAAACHCGMTAERAAAARAAAPAAARPLVRPASRNRRQAALVLWRSFPTDIKAFAVTAALVVVAGVGWTIFGPRSPDPTVPVLGYVDNLPPPAPKPAPRPAFKLPWWR